MKLNKGVWKHKNHICKNRDDASFHICTNTNHWWFTIVLDNWWLNWIKSSKGTFFELEQIFTVGSATLWKNNQWWKFSLFYKLLSFVNLLNQISSILFVTSVYKETTSSDGHGAYKRKFLGSLFGNKTGNTCFVLMNCNISISHMVWNSCTWLMLAFPVGA